MSKLLNRFFRYHRDSRATYRRDAEIVWEGEHLVVIRTGTSGYNSRDVYLVDKIGLLMDEDASALEQLAALGHPVQKERAQNLPEGWLHASCADQQSEDDMFTGRWCKAMRERIIEYAKEQDAEYEANLPSWIDEYDERQRQEKESEKRARGFCVAVLRWARKIGKTTRYYGRYTLHLPVTQVSFSMDGESETVWVNGFTHFALADFQKLVRLLVSFKPSAEEDE